MCTIFQSSIRSCNTSKFWLFACVFRTYPEQRVPTAISHLAWGGHGYLSIPINTYASSQFIHFANINRRIRKHRAFINFMLSANSAQQKAIVKSLTSEQYDVISEIALNIYTGTYPLTKKYINQLKLYQSYIRSLGSREVSTKQKRGILLKHLPLVSLLLKPIVHQIDKNGKRNDTSA